ncbi:hypothetical protein OWV82_013807 [Melia azedarach]|uniref:Uncharacterized protein n=1 Tax=Melia azedarach TaxID=155640 RepID=A0ACC1XVG3_MELAZ|nr:hypothetical protein OWV82_013807 [Melia azedarach]
MLMHLLIFLNLFETNSSTTLRQFVPPGTQSSWFSCGSAKQLKAKGIIFRCSESRQFTDVQFKYSWSFEGILKLPAIIIDDSTKTFLLNMIAYETSPDGPDDLGVSSYVCFMDSLIDGEEDVRELRSNGIICQFSTETISKLQSFFISWLQIWYRILLLMLM